MLNDGRTLWKTMEPELMQACSGCHGQGDTAFLAGTDPYRTFVSWPGIIAANPVQSILLTYAVMGSGHSGSNLDSTALKNTLLPKVHAWLAEEAKNFTKPPSPGPHIDPFVPILGFNAVYLDPLGADFKGIAVTFTAQELKGAALELTEIELHTTTKMGVHVVHPLFTVHPLGGTPDPNDAFSNVDQSFQAGTSGKLGTGTLVLVNWPADAKLSLAFEKIEAIPPGGPIVPGGCKSITAFTTHAEQHFLTCSTCHDGTNSQAHAALDMKALGIDSAQVCAQIKNRVNPLDPPKSQIFITTNPNGNAAHPFKFKGNASLFNSFKDAVSTWIAAEK